MLPAGLYNAEIVEETFGENENGKANVQLELKLKSQATAQGALPIDDGESTRVIRYFFVSEQNAEISIRGLRDLGWQGNDLADFHAGKSGLRGKQVRVQCTHRTFQKKNGDDGVTENWEIVTGNGGVRPNAQVPVAKAKAVTAQYKHLLAGKPVNRPPAARPPARQPAAVGAPADNGTGDDGEVPF
jgi:hypothetical protein